MRVYCRRRSSIRAVAAFSFAPAESAARCLLCGCWSFTLHILLCEFFFVQSCCCSTSSLWLVGRFRALRSSLLIFLRYRHCVASPTQRLSFVNSRRNVVAAARNCNCYFIPAVRPGFFDVAERLFAANLCGSIVYCNRHSYAF